MSQNNGWLWVGVVIAIVIAITAHLRGGTPVDQLGSYPTPGTPFVHGISVGNPTNLGTQPTNLSKVLANTCSLIASNFSVTASTTVAMDCAVTGVVSTDLALFGSFATSSATGAGWSIVGVSASSTNGFLTFRVANNTGTTAIIPASLASSTAYLVVGTQ